jgi:atypical dual specificity phosphatase
MARGFLDSFDKVDERLYIGDYFASLNYAVLVDNNITHILVCGEELSCRYPQEFAYKHLKIKDDSGTSISEYFDEVFIFISRGRKLGGVLVHCAESKSRSASMVLSYLMKSRQIRYKKAFKMLKKIHPLAQPNNGFIRQLIEYERKILVNQSSCFKSIC